MFTFIIVDKWLKLLKIAKQARFTQLKQSDTDGGQIKGKPWIKEWRNISNTDASVHQGSLNGLVSKKNTWIKCYSLSVP